MSRDPLGDEQGEAERQLRQSDFFGEVDLVRFKFREASAKDEATSGAVKLHAIGIGIGLVFLGSAAHANSFVDLNDGGIHTIDFSYGTPTTVRVDFSTPGAGTTVEVLPGAELTILESFEDGLVKVSGGLVSSGLSGVCGCIQAHDRSSISLSGGSMIQLGAEDQATLDVSGGLMEQLITSGAATTTVIGGNFTKVIAAFGSSQIDIWGVSTFYDGFRLLGRDNGTLVLHGSGYQLDGVPIGNGSIDSINGNDYIHDPARRLTGTLLDGSSFDVGILLGHQAQIILVPEPKTILLQAIGLLWMFLRGAIGRLVRPTYAPGFVPAEGVARSSSPARPTPAGRKGLR